MRGIILPIAFALATGGGPVLPPVTLRVWRDCSQSMRESVLRDVVARVLARFLEAHVAIEVVEVVRFSCGDELISEAPVVAHALDGAPAAPAARDQGDITLAAYFKQGQSVFAQQDHDAKQQAENAARSQRRERIAPLIAGLLTAPAVPSRCTRFDDLAGRVHEEGLAYNVIITDGWFDCVQAMTGERRSDGRILIVVLPTNQDRPPETPVFQQRKKDLLRLFPQAAVVQSFKTAAALEALLAPGSSWPPPAAR